MPTILKNHYALYMELFITPSVDRLVTFYETIKVLYDYHENLTVQNATKRDPSIT